MADIQLNSVTLATESSGTVTLDSAIAGIPAAGITGVLPVGVTGGSGLDAVSAGKFLQVVMGGMQASVTQAGNSAKNLVAGFNVTITPTAASSKILIQYNYDYCASTSVTAMAYIERDIAGAGYSELAGMQGADIGGSNGDPSIGHAGGVTAWKSDNCAGSYLDSPSYSLTNAITYRIGTYAESNQIIHIGMTNRDSTGFHPRCRSTLIAIEVAA